MLPPEDPSSSTEPWRPAPNARLYLLTHVHTDHLTGLSNAFTGKIVCSPDTKRMLLRLEAEIERERVDGGVREGRMLKYAGLKARTIGEGKTERMVDMIVRPTPRRICSRPTRCLTVRLTSRKRYLMVIPESTSSATRMANPTKSPSHFLTRIIAQVRRCEFRPSANPHLLTTGQVLDPVQNESCTSHRRYQSR